MLQLTCESSGLPLHCLDVLIDFDTKLNLYTTQKHYKHNDPKYFLLPPTKYTNLSTYGLPHTPYNTLTTVLHSAFTVCSHFQLLHIAAH